MTDELKPCPFCGTPAHFFQIDDETSREWGGQGICCKTEQCASIGLMWACGDDPKPRLAEIWNRRAPCLCQTEAKRVDGMIERGFGV